MRTVPGAIAFTRMPALPSSSAAVRMSASIPAFAAAYDAPNGIALSPDSDAMCTMLPPVPCASSCAATVRVVRNADCRLSRTTASHVSVGVVTSGNHWFWMPPATWTRPCSAPEPAISRIVS